MKLEYKIAFIWSIIFLTLCSCILVNAHPRELEYNNEKIVRVGWFPKTFYMEKNKDRYTGFCKEYIDKIADYANYKYEFVEGTYEELYDALVRGEIDIIPLLYKDKKSVKEINFATDSIYETMYVFTDKNHPLSERRLEDFNRAVVGYTSTEEVDRMKEYSKSKGLEFSYVRYEDTRQLANVIVNGVVDLVMTNNLYIESNQVLVDKVNNGELALAISKHRTDLLHEIDKVLVKIELENPQFTELLKQEYSKNDDIQFYLSPKEKELIEKYNSLTVAIDNHGAYQYYDNKTKKVKGVQIDILNRISEIVGIEFKYVTANANNFFEIGADIIGSIEKGEGSIREYGYRMTTPYLKMNLVSLRREKESLGEATKSAIFYKTTSLFENAAVYYNLDDMFNDLMAGKVDEVSITSLNADYYIRKHGLNGIIRIPISGLIFRNSMAIRKDLPIELLSIINRAILSIKQSEIQDFIAREEVYYERSFLSMLKEHPLAIIIISIATLAIFVIFFTVVITREKKHRKELLKISKQDPMTKVFNKIAAEDEIISVVHNNKDNHKYALAILDIDHFKSINDTYGHAVGDAVIIHFANLLRKHFSDQGIVGRMGGDEFIIFMKVTDKTIIKNVIESFLTEEEFNMDVDGIKIRINTSIGISIYPDNGMDSKELYKAADKALYDVKISGRANYKISEVHN